jgi:hypothetical protein
MLIRRDLLRLIPAPALLAAARAAEEPGYGRIDTHVHIHRDAPALLAALKDSHWRGLDIVVCPASAEEPFDLEGKLRATRQVARDSGGTTITARSDHITPIANQPHHLHFIKPLVYRRRLQPIVICIDRNIRHPRLTNPIPVPLNTTFDPRFKIESHSPSPMHPREIDERSTISYSNIAVINHDRPAPSASSISRRCTVSRCRRLRSRSLLTKT